MKWNDIQEEGYQSKLESLECMQSFEVLGISEDSSIKTIKSAYKEKMKIYHPDKNRDFTKGYGESISKILSNAYNIMIERKKNATK